LYSYAKDIDLLIKESAPLEGFYNVTTKEKLPDEEIFDEEETDTVYDYKEKFKLVSQNIFIFYFENKDLNTPEGKKIRALANGFTEGIFRRVEETGASLQLLNYFPEIKNFLQAECQSRGIDYESIIVIFMKRHRQDTSVSQSAEFVIHDLGHMVLGDGENSPDADEVIREFMRKKYSEIYKDEYGNPLDLLLERRVDAVLAATSLNERQASLVDWGHHIFAKAVSEESGYIKTPKYIDVPRYISSKTKEEEVVRYFLDENCKEGVCAKEIEAELDKMCKDMVSNIKGKVFINFM